MDYINNKKFNKKSKTILLFYHNKIGPNVNNNNPNNYINLGYVSKI